MSPRYPTNDSLPEVGLNQSEEKIGSNISKRELGGIGILAISPGSDWATDYLHQTGPLSLVEECPGSSLIGRELP